MATRRNKKRVSVYLDDERLNNLDYLCKKFDMSMTSIINMAIINYYDNVRSLEIFTSDELREQLKKLGAKEISLSKKK